MEELLVRVPVPFSCLNSFSAYQNINELNEFILWLLFSTFECIVTYVLSLTNNF